MPTYAYRRADGSVSVCTARDKTEAAQLFDRIESVSRKLVIRLKAGVFITLRPDIDKWWMLDEGEAQTYAPVGHRRSTKETRRGNRPAGHRRPLPKGTAGTKQLKF